MNKRLKKKLAKRQQEATISQVTATKPAVKTVVVSPVIKPTKTVGATPTVASKSTHKVQLTKQTLPLDKALYPIYNTLLAAANTTATKAFNQLMLDAVANSVATEDIVEVGAVLATYEEATARVTKYFKSKTAVRPLTAKMLTDDKARTKRFDEIIALATDVAGLATESAAVTRSTLALDLTAQKQALTAQLATIAAAYNAQLDETQAPLSL
ncbi:hypothetical protein [Brochothrix campestris]|uniref:Uncharacterized protein n=1 Tax=Brochothrix campestris FSL F6-1037 TaxID=1265861 RepID=W7CHY2_9LIST|nr:hypothetical protein [Brochothrix campestris]EUJ38989.1 hypothetical protein BCAMP_08270 [Brochothrix campestris FSL F6-1037]